MDTLSFSWITAFSCRPFIYYNNDFFLNINPFKQVSKSTSAETSKVEAYVQPLLPIDLPSYEALRNSMKKGSSLYITDETGTHKETLLELLGDGGTKRAFKLAAGRALLLPNIEVEAKSLASDWERIVLEEVKMSEILTRLGLLSPLHKQVTIATNEDSPHVIPAYISETFENLEKTKSVFIIDSKAMKSSTWILGTHFLFNSDEERLEEKNWDPVFAPLLNDIKKICLHNIPTERDSINIAIVKEPSVIRTCQYLVRFFGFDYSKKRGRLDFSKIRQEALANLYIDPVAIVESRKLSPGSKSKFHAGESIDSTKFEFLLDIIIKSIFICEFGENRYFSKRRDESLNLQGFKDRLVQKYISNSL